MGVGEHLGYLLTGAWTLLAAASIVTTTAIPAWLGWIGALIGLALIVGSAEFAGPNERDGWRLAGIVVPIAYIAWSIWLIALGVFLLSDQAGPQPVGAEAPEPSAGLGSNIVRCVQGMNQRSSPIQPAFRHATTRNRPSTTSAGSIRARRRG